MFDQLQGFVILGVLLFFLGGSIWCFDNDSKWKWFFYVGLALYILIPVTILIIAFYNWLVEMYIRNNTIY